MTKEQEESLEKLKRQILIGECEKNIGISVFVSDLKNVLAMIEEKDKIIELMAKYIAKKEVLIDKNFNVLTTEAIKQYFKKQVT